MKTAEKQIWDEALRLEKSRVEKIQTDAMKDGRKTAVVFRPQSISKPWTWGSSANYSLHDVQSELVMSVELFDFSLENSEFVEFLRERSHLHLCGRPGSAYWQLLDDPETDEKTFLSNDALQYAQEWEGQRHKYSDQDMRSFWRIFQFSRVFLQGAYDRMKRREVAS